LPTHAHFEELCVLAASGQLSPVESDLLNQHLLDCDNCRSFLKDAHFISDKIISRVLHTPRSNGRVPAGMRERFLALAANGGLQIHAGPPVEAEPVPNDSEPLLHGGRPERRFPLPHILVASLRPWQASLLAVAACVACFAIGARFKTPPLATSPATATGTLSEPPPGAQAPRATDAELRHIRALTAGRDRFAKQITDLGSQLEAVKKSKDDTEASLRQELSQLQSGAARDHDALVQQSAALSSHAADLQLQLTALRLEQSLADEDLRNQRAKTAEYSARLDLLQTQMRNQDAAPLFNPDEIGSLVAARNLHIIDVYDSNTAGRRQRAFGRVFYVEGRSLVFYAYDLTATHTQKNITFHLWGEQAGSKETTLSLGILHDDDPKERRLALKVDDPKVLAKINSVYVTAESASRQNDAPRGPRVLYAYFGAPPNHP
jgi:hypothetical protein